MHGTVWWYNSVVIAGYGGLSLSIEGPSKADIDCKDKPDGTCQVTYKPTQSGTYVISIKFADEHVPGMYKGNSATCKHLLISYVYYKSFIHQLLISLTLLINIKETFCLLRCSDFLCANQRNFQFLLLFAMFIACSWHECLADSQAGATSNDVATLRVLDVIFYSTYE